MRCMPKPGDLLLWRSPEFPNCDTIGVCLKVNDTRQYAIVQWLDMTHPVIHSYGSFETTFGSKDNNKFITVLN